VKFRLFNPRLFLRGVKELSRIANALEDLRDGYFKSQGILGSVRIPASPDEPDPGDDTVIGYATDEETAKWQAEDAKKRKGGFPVPHGDLY